MLLIDINCLLRNFFIHNSFLSELSVFFEAFVIFEISTQKLVLRFSKGLIGKRKACNPNASDVFLLELSVN